MFEAQAEIEYQVLLQAGKAALIARVQARQTAVVEASMFVLGFLMGIALAHWGIQLGILPPPPGI